MNKKGLMSIETVMQRIIWGRTVFYARDQKVTFMTTISGAEIRSLVLAEWRKNSRVHFPIEF
jgi:hypothetical protein